MRFASSFEQRDQIAPCLLESGALRAVLARTTANLVLIDVTQGIDLEEVRSVAAAYPELALVALGLCEQRQDIIRCGRAGFVGYVARDASIDALCQSMLDIATGRLQCSAEISGSLLRALFHATPRALISDDALTRREGEVLQLIGRGLSNKEIARSLRISESTVKVHVAAAFRLLGVHNRVGAVAALQSRGDTSAFVRDQFLGRRPNTDFRTRVYG